VDLRARAASPLAASREQRPGCGDGWCPEPCELVANGANLGVGDFTGGIVAGFLLRFDLVGLQS